MNRFKVEAFERIQKFNTELIPTGTGRWVRRTTTTAHLAVSPSKALFSHQALQADIDPVDLTPKTPASPAYSDTVSSVDRTIGKLAKTEVKRILLVDPLEICLRLLSKAFKLLLPHVEIVTATSSKEALSIVATSGPFDIVVIEERFKLFHRSTPGVDSAEYRGTNEQDASGSIVLQQIASMSSSALFIGTSSRLQIDGPRLLEHGADWVWPKPPPTMSSELLRELVQRVLTKRGKPHLVNELLPQLASAL